MAESGYPRADTAIPIARRGLECLQIRDSSADAVGLDGSTGESRRCAINGLTCIEIHQTDLVPLSDQRPRNEGA